MGKNLTSSIIDRQNILNNNYAIDEIQKASELRGIPFDNQVWLTKSQAALFFEIDDRTIERYLKDYEDELKHNGYSLLKGKKLKEFKILLDSFAPDMNVGSKTTQLGIFNFRSFLNLAMLLQESDRARILRQTILDIVIDVINKKTGGGTKYINQRDEDFLLAYFQGENYRKEFTDALQEYVLMGKTKYAIYTNKIYISIFKEKAEEYRKILKLEKTENLRDTFYSEVLDLVASYEYGFARILEEAYKKAGSKLTVWQVDNLFHEFEKQAHWKPLIERARSKMASRDMAFRDALHRQLEDYIVPLDPTEFERFLGEKSKELVERLEEAKDVMKRLKERD